MRLSIQRLRLAFVVMPFFLFIGLLLNSYFQQAAAQGDEENPWTEPINLSQSGAATEPVLLEDNNGQFHVLWLDTLSGFFYTSGDGENWTPPQLVEVPFGTRIYYPTLPATQPTPRFIPHLNIDNRNVLHAFWSDEIGTLYHSQVPVADVTSFAAWTSRQVLATSVLTVDSFVLANNNIHLIYASASSQSETAAGVYHLASTDGGATWSTARALYQSAYFRVLAPDAAHLSLTRGGSEEQLIAAWDDPLLETVFITQSTNSGQSWTASTAVDSRQTTDPSNGIPVGQLIVGAAVDSIHLVWQAAHADALAPTTSCAFYHSWSSDGGVTWTERQRILSENPGCPQTSQFITDSNGTLWLLATTESLAYLQAWAGQSWGGSQAQSTLKQFTDTQTFRVIEFACQQANIQDGNLLVVGCGTGRGQDVWFTQRPLGDMADWLPEAVETTIWQAPRTVAAAVPNLSDPHIITDNEGRDHLFWSQRDLSVAASNNEAIYYAVREDDRWSVPTLVLNSPSGDVDNLTVTFSPNGRLLVAWDSARTGSIYFSQGNPVQAANPNQWSVPIALPTPDDVSKAPDIAVALDGTIFVAYTITLNEMRGLYLISSRDNGSNWSEPQQVFDGAAAAWSAVGAPRLAINRSGMHILWTEDSVLAEDESLGLFYARSEDEGDSWSEATIVVESPVLWYDLVAFGERSVHRVWRERSGSRATLWHEQSIDGGIAWQRPNRIAAFSAPVGGIALATDPSTRLHLVQFADTGAGDFELTRWFWAGESWQTIENVDLEIRQLLAHNSLTAAAGSDGRLVLAYTQESFDTESQAIQQTLFYSGRSLDLPNTSPTPLPTLTPTPLPTATVTPTPSPTPDPTIDISSALPGDEEVSLGPVSLNSTTGIVLGILLALLLIGGVVLVTIRATRFGRHQ